MRKLFWKYFLIPFSPQGEPVYNQHVLGAGAGGQGDDGGHQGDDHHGVHDHHDLISVTPTLLFPLYHPPSLVTTTLHYYLTLIYQESPHCVARQCACADSLQTQDSFRDAACLVYDDYTCEEKYCTG